MGRARHARGVDTLPEAACLPSACLPQRLHPCHCRLRQARQRHSSLTHALIAHASDRRQPDARPRKNRNRARQPRPPTARRAPAQVAAHPRAQVTEKLRLDLSNDEAAQFFQELMNDSVSALFPQITERLHRWAQCESTRPPRLSFGVVSSGRSDPSATHLHNGESGQVLALLIGLAARQFAPAHKRSLSPRRSSTRATCAFWLRRHLA